jgi:protein SCO1/2
VRRAVLALAAAAAVLAALPAAFGAREAASARAEAAARASAAPPAGGLPFPVAIRADFDLVDHHGRRRIAERVGRPMAVFFGYANCEAICSAAIPLMAAAVEAAGPAGASILPVMITVDPARDTPREMRRALGEISPRLLGLTGDERALAAARAAFGVEAKEIMVGPDGHPIIAHGSFVYLVGADGRVRSVLPPILGPERMAELMVRHLGAGA